MGYLAQNFATVDVNWGEVSSEIDRISGVISNTIDPEVIFLFGSAADGTFKAHSDIDLLIVMTSNEKIRGARLALASKKMKPKWTCDYLFVTMDRFEKMKDLGGPIYMAEHFGRVLYDKRTKFIS